MNRDELIALVESALRDGAPNGALDLMSFDELATLAVDALITEAAIIGLNPPAVFESHDD